jgi:hypothetical protein
MSRHKHREFFLHTSNNANNNNNKNQGSKHHHGNEQKHGNHHHHQQEPVIVAVNPCNHALPKLQLNPPLPANSHFLAGNTFETIASKYISCHEFHAPCKGAGKHAPITWKCLTMSCKYLKDSDLLTFRITLHDKATNEQYEEPIDVISMVYIGAGTEESKGEPTYRFAPIDARSATESLITNIETKLTEIYKIRITPRHSRKHNYTLNSTNTTTNTNNNSTNDDNKSVVVQNNYSVANMFVGEGFTVGVGVDSKDAENDPTDDSPASAPRTIYSEECLLDLHRQNIAFNHILHSVVSPSIVNPDSEGKDTNGNDKQPFHTATQFCCDDVIMDAINGNIPADGVIDNNFRPLFANKVSDKEVIIFQIHDFQTRLQTTSPSSPDYQPLVDKISQLQNQLTTLNNNPNHEILSIMYRDYCHGINQTIPINLFQDLVSLLPNFKAIVIEHQQFFAIQATWRYCTERRRFILSDVKLPHIEDTLVVPVKLNIILDQIKKAIAKFMKINVRADNASTVA